MATDIAHTDWNLDHLDDAQVAVEAIWQEVKDDVQRLELPWAAIPQEGSNDIGSVVSTVSMTIGEQIDGVKELGLTVEEADAAIEQLSDDLQSEWNHELTTQKRYTDAQSALETKQTERLEYVQGIQAVISEYLTGRQQYASNLMTLDQWRDTFFRLVSTYRENWTAIREIDQQMPQFQDAMEEARGEMLGAERDQEQIAEFFAQIGDIDTRLDQLREQSSDWVEETLANTPLTLEVVDQLDAAQSLTNNAYSVVPGTMSPRYWRGHLQNWQSQPAAVTKAVPFKSELSIHNRYHNPHLTNFDFSVKVGEKFGDSDGGVVVHLQHRNKSVTVTGKRGGEIVFQGPMYLATTGAIDLHVDVQRSGEIIATVKLPNQNRTFSASPPDEPGMLKGDNVEQHLGRATATWIRFGDYPGRYHGITQSTLRYDQHLPENVSNFHLPFETLTDEVTTLKQSWRSSATVNETVDALQSAQGLLQQLDTEIQHLSESRGQDWEKADSSVVTAALTPHHEQHEQLTSDLEAFEQQLLLRLEQQVIEPSLRAVRLVDDQLFFNVASPHDTSYVAIREGGLMSQYSLSHEGGTLHGRGKVTVGTEVNSDVTVMLYEKPGGTVLDEMVLERVNYTQHSYSVADPQQQWRPEEFIRGRQAYFSYESSHDVVELVDGLSGTAVKDGFMEADAIAAERFEEKQTTHGWMALHPQTAANFSEAVSRQYGLYAYQSDAWEKLTEKFPYIKGGAAFTAEMAASGVTAEMLNSRIGDMSSRLAQAIEGYNQGIQTAFKAANGILILASDGVDVYGNNPTTPWNVFQQIVATLKVPFVHSGLTTVPVDVPTPDQIIKAAKEYYFSDDWFKEHWQRQVVQEQKREYASMRQHLRDLQADAQQDSEALNIHRVTQQINDGLVLGDYYEHFAQTESRFLFVEPEQSDVVPLSNSDTSLDTSDYRFVMSLLNQGLQSMRGIADNVIGASEQAFSDKAQQWISEFESQASDLERAAETLDQSTIEGKGLYQLYLGRARIRHALSELMTVFAALHPDDAKDLSIDLVISGIGVIQLPKALVGLDEVAELFDIIDDIESYQEDHP